MSKALYTQESLFDLMQPASWHGRYFKTKCPFHDDREPSFLVFENGGQCLSLSCRKRASLKQVYERLHGIVSYSGGQRVYQFFDWYAVPDLEVMADEAHEILQHETGLQHYLYKRKVADSIEQAQLGWWLGWYTFPVHDRQRNVIGMMLRASPSMQEATKQRWLAPPGQSTLLYSPDWAKVHHAKKVYLVFGIVDALAVHQLGYAVIAPTFLKGLRAEMLDFLRKPIYVIPDYGELTYGRELVSRLGWRGQLIELPYPADAKDIAGWIELHAVTAELAIALNQ